MPMVLGAVLCLGAPVVAQPHQIIFSDTFDDSIANSVTDPVDRATGKWSDLVKYEWKGGDTESVQVVDGKLDWVGKTDKKGRLLKGSGRKVMLFKDADGEHINWNKNGELSQKSYDISFSYKRARNHQLNFRLWDTAPILVPESPNNRDAKFHYNHIVHNPLDIVNHENPYISIMRICFNLCDTGP